jgi:hypothetical protein
MSMDSHGGITLTGENRSTRRKTCPSVTLSTINFTQHDQGAIPGPGSERQATNSLSHGSVEA